jgi:copper(I)-binding protein
MRASIRATAGLIIAAALSFPMLAHAADGKGTTISNPWVRATPGGAKITAAFMEIKSEAGDKLLSAKSDVAGRVEVHTHIMEGDVMKMRRVESLEVAQGASRLLKPMGDHIMLMDLKSALKEGDSVKLTLTFERAGDVDVVAPVEAAGSMGPKGSKESSKGDAKSGDEHHHHGAH